MKKIVDEEGLGVVTSEFSVEEMARKLNQLSADDVMSFKRKSCEAAKKYNADAAIAHIRQAAERLTSR
jgi:UDP:flavonoid glycosyltransferase YjiC (YdhE family)